MLTIFTIPKAFEGHIAVIQRNAIRSWLALVPRPDIILLGNDAGVAEAAKEFGIVHAPDVAVNEYGTYLLDDAFRKAHALAATPLLMYVNADIIIPQRLPSIIEKAHARYPKGFMMIGQRQDFVIEKEVGDKPNWKSIEQLAFSTGTLHPAWGSDYFAYPKGAVGNVPPFAVGRPFWDNWMIYRIRRKRLPVIDASSHVLVLHQNHDYAHVAGAKDRYFGPEAEQNKAYLGALKHYDLFKPIDATRIVDAQGAFHIPLDKPHIKRWLQTFLVLHRDLQNATSLKQRVLLRLLAGVMACGVGTLFVLSYYGTIDLAPYYPPAFLLLAFIFGYLHLRLLRKNNRQLGALYAEVKALTRPKE